MTLGEDKYPKAVLTLGHFHPDLFTSALTKDRHPQLFPDLPERAWLAAYLQQRHPMCGYTASTGQGLGSVSPTDNWKMHLIKQRGLSSSEDEE